MVKEISVNSYITRGGIEITGKMLNHYEDMGLSEVEIGKKFNLNRLQLYRIRKKLGFPVRFRSDKGVERVDRETKRKNWNAYMRRYYLEHYSVARRVNIRVGDKKVSLARHNAVIVIGRQLLDVEVVDHIDGNPRNNGYENLMVFANEADRLAYHRGEDVKPVESEII